MPPVSSEELNYNGSDIYPCQISPGVSNGVPESLRDEAQTNARDINVNGEAPGTQIDPPEGFEPNPNVTPNSNCKLNGNKTDDNGSSDSTPSNYSILTDADNVANAIIRPPDISDQVQTENRNVEETQFEAGYGPLRGGETTNLNEMQPTPSTSSQRILSSLNNIVSKLSKAFVNSLNTDRCAQEEMPKFAFSHKRTREKTWKLMDEVVSRCQDSRMNLNNSPPYILEILPETFKHLKLIHARIKYDSGPSYPEDDSGYSQVFLRNLQNRCKQTLKLFKDAKEDMFDEESDYRHKLTRHTLVFNHILSELKAIFPDGQFIGEKYLITKKETAGEFWKNSFGSSVLVDWKTFYHALQQVHNIDSSFFSLHALKQTIDLTCDDYISIFEFDVFTRLFQPWSTLLRNWQILAVTHPGYKAFLTYDELKARLQKLIDKPGSYVFRLSCTRLGQWAIGYVTPDKQILQTIVQNISLSQALTETKFYLYPDGKDEDPSLSVLCSGMTGDERNVTVTEEQYEIYCGVGNSFQTCKICFENDKDVRVEPCNHLLCTSCLLAWQKSEKQTCPYCRTEIKEAVQITMDLPETTR